MGRIEGYAIVSEDGMLANAARIMPDSLVFKADQEFFERGLDAVDVVVHGRHSQERQKRSPLRRRLILTRSIPSIVSHPSNDLALLWNPAGATLEDALLALGQPRADIGVIGGADVFVLFLDRYDVFHLSQAPGVRLPGGYPIFPGVPAVSPKDVLEKGGLTAGPGQILDAEQGLTLVSWHRAQHS